MMMMIYYQYHNLSLFKERNHFRLQFWEVGGGLILVERSLGHFHEEGILGLWCVNE